MAQTTIELTCGYCNNKVIGRLAEHKRRLAVNPQYIAYCNAQCMNAIKKNRQLVNCDQCDEQFEKRVSEILDTGHNFCSDSCSAKFTNKVRDKFFYDEEKMHNVWIVV